jgi:hypothetical protein
MSKEDKIKVIEKAPGTSSGLYYTKIKPLMNILRCKLFLKIQNPLRSGMRGLAILDSR